MVDLFFASVSSLAPLEREVRVGPGLALGKSLHFSMSQFPHPQKEGAHSPRSPRLSWGADVSIFCDALGMVSGTPSEH